MLQKVRPYFDLDTKLCNIPDAWLKLIEPRITREGTCWHWQGGLDIYGEPVMSFYDVMTKSRTTRRTKVFIMEMFWEGLDGHTIIHKCQSLTCINPAHLVAVFGRGMDTEKIAKRVARYNKNKS